MQIQMKLDFLFNRGPSGASWRDRREPRFVEEPVAAPSAGIRVALPPPAAKRATRRMSPRQLAVWAHEMYLCGSLSWEEYRMAGFPAELHPDYNRTVGALTGQLAEPDRPRDMVKEWEERLAFTVRHNAPFDAQVQRTEKILNLLRRQALQSGLD